MLQRVGKLVGKGFAYPLRAIVGSKAYENKIGNKITQETIDDIVSLATLTSIVAKDGIGCGMYVYQSMNNDKIPEERRDFVWKLDAVNGVLMIGFQILFFLGMRKFNDKLFNKAFKIFNKKNFNSLAEQIRVDQKSIPQIPSTKGDLGTEFDAMKASGLAVFKSVTELVASTILAKRVVVPFISTYITDILEEHDKKKKNALKGDIPMTGNEPKKLDITSTSDVTNLIEKYKLQNK